MKKVWFSGLLLLLLPLAACLYQTGGISGTNGGTEPKPLARGAIPDQAPQKLQLQYDKLAAYLQKELGVSVKYKLVNDYGTLCSASFLPPLGCCWRITSKLVKSMRQGGQGGQGGQGRKSCPIVI